MKNIKIAILRGLMPRSVQIDFSKSFTKFKSIFLSEENLGRQKIFFTDPVKLFFGKTTHQSWVGVNDKKLEKAVKEVDVVETYELYHFFSGQVADTTSKLKTPLITEVWTSFKHLAYFTPPYSWNVQKVIKNTDLFIARSMRAQKALIDLKIPKNKIKMIYQGVDIKKFKPKKFINKNKIFLFVGEMEKYKGVDVILKAWKIYFKNHLDSKLIMAGKGSLSKKAKYTPGVYFVGYVNHSELPKIYQEANIFLAPSINRYIGPFLWWEEFFSYTLMEAMASGLSIIGSNSGGIPEEIGNKNIIIRQNNVSDLVKAMEKVKIKNSNRVRAEKYFDLYKNTKKLEDETIKLLPH